MAKNMFINTTGLEIEKSVPALTGIDFSGFKPMGLDVNIGAVISDLAAKSKELKEKNNYLKLQSELDKIDDAYKQEYLTDPNIYSTEEGRTSLLKGYNSIVEKKKALLSAAKNGLNADQYTKISDYFKQQTSSTMFKMQHDINVGYIKEVTDDTLLQANTVLESLTTIDDEALRNQKVGDVLESFGGLRKLGIDPTEMQLKFAVNAQKKLTDYEINTKIINNYTNPDFFLRDKNGNPILDSNGNHIMDNAKKNTAILALDKTFLSDKAINDAAKELTKYIKVDFNTARAYIKNNREGDWLKVKAEAQKKIAYQQAIEHADIIKQEQAIKNAGYDQQQKVIDKKYSNWQDLYGTATGSIQGKDMYYDPVAVETLTGGRFNNLKDMRKAGYRAKTIDEGVENNVKSLIANGDYEGLEYTVSTLFDGNAEVDMNTAADLQYVTGIPANMFLAMSGKYWSATTPPKQIVDMIAISKRPDNVSTTDLARDVANPFGNFASGYEKANLVAKLSVEMVSQDPEVAGIVKGDVNTNFTTQVNKLINNYNSNDKVKAIVDRARQMVDSNWVKDNRVLYRVDTNPNTKLMTDAYLYGAGEQMKKTGGSIEGTQAYTEGMSITSGANTLINLSGGLTDYQISQIENGNYDLRTLPRENYNNAKFRELIAPYIVRALTNGKMQITDVPQEMYNDPLVNAYYESLRNK